MSLKQSSTDSSDESGGRGISDCWRRERDRICLRVEMRADEVFIFPYQQFLGAHHVRIAADETLKITLSTHEVTLSGHRFAQLFAALQEFAVDCIRPFPPRYHDLGRARAPRLKARHVRALGR